MHTQLQGHEAALAHGDIAAVGPHTRPGQIQQGRERAWLARLGQHAMHAGSGLCGLQLPQFGLRVRVEEGGFVVEHHLHHVVLRSPLAGLAPAGA